MADFDQNAKGGPFAKFSKWPIFLAEVQKLQKIGNTSPIFLAEGQKLQKIGNTGPILASLVCMDAEFILVSNDTKSAKK